jgi:hypothetical protein
MGMDDSYAYATKKLAEAIYALAGVGCIQERLTSAAECLLLLQEDDLSPAQRAECIALRQALTTTPLKDQAPRAVRDTEAVMLARQIVGLYTAVVGSSDAPLTPLIAL